MKKFIKNSVFQNNELKLDYSNDASLASSISYSDWENNSRYYITALSAHNEKVYPSVSKPSYILVYKREGGMSGIDAKFKQLFDSYTSGFKKLDVNEGKTTFQNNIENEIGQSVSESSSIKFSKPGGDWFVVFASDASNIRSSMKQIIEKMEASLIPFIQSNLLFYYSIESPLTGNKITYSAKGQEHLKSESDSTDKQLSNYKFLIDLGLSKYPECKKILEQVIDRTGYKNIQPVNYNIDIKKSELINSIIESTDSISIEIHKNLISFNDNNLTRLEKILTSVNRHNIKENDFSYFFYHFMLNYDELFGENGPMYVQKEWFYHDFSKFISDINEENKFYKLTNHLSEVAENSMIHGDKFMVHMIMGYYEFLNLSRSVKDAYEKYEFQVNELRRQNEQERIQKEKESQKKLNFEIAVYDLKNDIGFTNIDGYNDFGDYLVSAGQDYEWAEDSYLDAYNEVTELTYRPEKIKYGTDEKEIEDDIYVYNDKFLDDINFWDKDTPESNELDKLINESPKESEEIVNAFINNHLKQEFIKWREDQINEDFSEDFEPDTNDIYEAQEEILQHRAYENGFALFNVDLDKNQLKIKLNQKYKQNVLTLLKEVKRVNNDIGYDFIVILDYQDAGSESLYFKQI